MGDAIAWRTRSGEWNLASVRGWTISVGSFLIAVPLHRSSCVLQMQTNNALD